VTGRVFSNVGKISAGVKYFCEQQKGDKTIPVVVERMAMSDDSEEEPTVQTRVDPRDRDFRTPVAEAPNGGKFTLSPELRIANALEYSAYQLGQINKKLDKLIAQKKD
jgi:hypothetical protein